MPTKSDDSLVALLEQLDKALKPTSKTSRFKTISQMERDTGWPRTRLTALLHKAKAAGRLESGVTLAERLDGGARSVTGFAIKPVQAARPSPARKSRA